MARLFLIIFLYNLSAITSLHALPSGMTVVAGTVSSSFANNTLQLIVSDGAVVEWTDFSINASETVQLIQPTTSATALFQVTGANMSQLLGSLEANGAVCVINEQGLLVGTTGNVAAESFIGSTLTLANNLFTQGIDLQFSGSSTAVVIQLGTISVNAGMLALLSHQIDNRGSLTSPGGTLALLSGHNYTINTSFIPNINVQANLPGEGISNSGPVEALHVYLEADRSAGVAIRQNEGITLLEEGGNLTLATSGGAIMLAYGANLTAPAGSVSIQATSTSNAERIYLFGAVDASGSSGGSISIQGDHILHAGSVNANGTNHVAGTITIQAAQSFLGTELGSTSANAPNNGGAISLFGTSLLAAGNHYTSAGTIHILGEQISLISANVNASGNVTGGQILIGGGVQGSNPHIPNAQSVFIAPTTTISANGSYTGGTIVVWSELETENFGILSSSGPVQGHIDVASRGVLVQKGTLILGL